MLAGEQVSGEECGGGGGRALCAGLLREAYPSAKEGGWCASRAGGPHERRPGPLDRRPAGLKSQLPPLEAHPAVETPIGPSTTHAETNQRHSLFKAASIYL